MNKNHADVTKATAETLEKKVTQQMLEEHGITREFSKEFTEMVRLEAKKLRHELLHDGTDVS